MTVCRHPTVLLIQPLPSGGEDSRADEGGLSIRTSHAEVGYEIARTRRPDIVAIDVGIAGGPGWALCRLLKRDPLTASIPVVILTATHTPETAVHARYVGACAVLAERASIEDLMAAVRRA
jgi:DNA-binding response OmpR family regulator